MARKSDSTCRLSTPNSFLGGYSQLFLLNKSCLEKLLFSKNFALTLLAPGDCSNLGLGTFIPGFPGIFSSGKNFYIVVIIWHARDGGITHFTLMYFISRIRYPGNKLIVYPE